MSLLGYHKTYTNIKRGREIISTLVKHGFTHLLARLHMQEMVPGLTRVKASITDTQLNGDKNEEISPATRWRMVFQELGATFIKFGQILATRPDILPANYIKEFSLLQDSVDFLPLEDIRRTVEKSLGRPIEKIFAQFDPQPIASGSIGQVHKAILNDGQPVVVKVKRPGTDDRIREDLDLLLMLAGMAEKYMEELRVIRPRMIVEEFARMMERELDFVGEASYTAKFDKDFEDDETIVAPKVYWDYATRDTLVLQRVEGSTLTEVLNNDETEVDKKELASTLGRCLMRQYFVTGFFHADPHPGNIIVRDAKSVTLIDFGQMGHLSDDLRRQLAMTIIALTQGDVDYIVDLYAEIGVFTEETNLREFKSEFASLIDRYYGIPLERLDIASALHEALDVARSHHIILPRDFVLLGKSFVTITGVVRNLDPEFRIDTIVRPFSKEIFANLLSPGGMAKRAGFYLYRMFSLFKRAPEDIRDVVDKIKHGHLRILFRHEGLDNMVMHIERSANRLTLGIIIAAIIIGSSIVLSAGQNAMGSFTLPYVGNIPIATLVASVGFISAMVIGMLVAWGIIRGNRV